MKLNDKDIGLIRALMTKVEIDESLHGAKRFNESGWTLGKLLIETDNLTTHKRIYKIGDKTFEQMKIAVINMPEYKTAVESFKGDRVGVTKEQAELIDKLKIKTRNYGSYAYDIRNVFEFVLEKHNDEIREAFYTSDSFCNAWHRGYYVIEELKIF